MLVSTGMTADRDARVTVNQEFADAESFIAEYVANISQTGVFIRSDEPLPAGTTVTLRFTIIMGDMETIEGTGRVVRVSQDPPGMGIAFISLTDDSERLLARLLRGGYRS